MQYQILALKNKRNSIWYEAQAYAKFMGNILPPYFHWAKAAFPLDEWVSPLAPEMLSQSNYRGKDISNVGVFELIVVT